MDQKFTGLGSTCEPVTKPQITSNRDVALVPPGKWRVEGEVGLYRNRYELPRRR
jgi:hypothetical protein